MNNYQRFYHQIAAPFRKSPLALMFLRGLNQLVVWVMYLAYFIILWWAVNNDQPALWRLIIVPGGCFILLSLVRQRLNQPRPYEKFAIDPLINRHKTGDSMPSRHVFSATIIAMCGLKLSISWGIFLLSLAIVSAVTRVIGGVHFPRDVIVGFLCGLAGGILLLI